MVLNAPRSNGLFLYDHSRSVLQGSFQLLGRDHFPYLGCHGTSSQPKLWRTGMPVFHSRRDPNVGTLDPNPSQSFQDGTSNPCCWTAWSTSSRSLYQTTCWESSEAPNQTGGKSGRVLVFPGWMGIINVFNEALYRVLKLCLRMSASQEIVGHNLPFNIFGEGGLGRGNAPFPIKVTLLQFYQT